MDILGKVQSVDKALLILKLLADRRREMKLTEIAEEMDINKSTLHGIISTLKYHGFVDQDGKTQKYRLGLYLIELGEISSSSLDIIKITSPIIEQVSSKLQETVHIASLDNFEVVYVNKKESNQSMRIYTSIGSRNPAYCTGVGKAMLAYLEKDYMEEMIPQKLEKLTPNTLTDRQEFIDALDRIREEGIAFDREEFSVGLTCIAAPIFDSTGKAKYAISVSGPTVRMSEDKIQKSIASIKSAAKEISIKIGYKE
ncbi:MAG: IclR family transcriptional regulator [Sedimentibacter sp.]|uniref:IclR family transcriptional regulator n=1 Tax=Sedimentibacter sp. TaxID=1960295 RepID=UPI0031582303